jgi:regulator of replication initiation timing
MCAIAGPEVKDEALDPKKKEKKTLAQQVAKLEEDFTYQYGYNEELILENKSLRETLVAKQQLVHEAGEHLANERIAFAKDKVALIESMTWLQNEVEVLSQPKKIWKKIAAVGWILAVLLGGALAYENFVESLDSLQSRVSILLSSE